MDPKDLERVGATWQHPVDQLEPELADIRRDDLEKYLTVMSEAISWILRAKNARVGAWQVAYALGLSQSSASMMELAAKLHVERATISNGARSFIRLLDMPPALAQRSAEASKAYSARRKSTLKPAATRKKAAKKSIGKKKRTNGSTTKRRINNTISRRNPKRAR